MSGTSIQRAVLDFSPGTRDNGNKENNVPTLRLIQFSKAPFLTFGTVKLGTSKSAVLQVENPTDDAEAEVTVEKIPAGKGFSVDHRTFTIQVSDDPSYKRYSPHRAREPSCCHTHCVLCYYIFVFAASGLIQFDSNMDSSRRRRNQRAHHLQCQWGPQTPGRAAGESRGTQEEKGDHPPLNTEAAFRQMPLIELIS